MRRRGRWMRWACGLALLVPMACTKNAPTVPTVEESPAPANAPATPDERYTQTFAQATTTELGEEQQIPPDRTIAGKPTAPMREQIERLWPTIKLTDDDGKPLPWGVTLDTEEGPVEITLHPEYAPNHVRNFLALTKIGYYDGLRFDRIVRQEGITPDQQKVTLDLLKAGCPAGTGDAGVGHIGYHLKPEASDAKHEEGTVGIWHDLDPNTAGVRFYITLGPAPVLDGSFAVIGKVTRGLETVKRIATGKLLPPDQDPARELPERPVVIKKAQATLPSSNTLARQP